MSSVFFSLLHERFNVIELITYLQIQKSGILQSLWFRIAQLLSGTKHGHLFILAWL